MLVYDDVPLLQVRVPTIVSTLRDVQYYDQDNLYPQRCEEAVKRSYTLRSVVNSIADFLNGEGFADPALAKLVVNKEGLTGETLNKLLLKVSKTYSRFESLAVHVAYNANLRATAFTYLPFAYCRYGLPIDGDDSKCVNKIQYSTNWEMDGRKEVNRTPQVISYDIYNDDPDVIANQIEEAGGIKKYKGQILYLTPDYYQYPTATFDPVLDHAQTQEELGKFKLGYTQNGMMATLAIMHPGEFESDSERQKFKRYVKDRQGARNANKTFAFEDKSGTRKISDLMTSLQPANLDKIFESTEEAALKAIIENEGWPKILVGVQTENTLFNTESLVDAYTYANAKTRNRRAAISEIFASLLSNWQKPIITDALIKEQQYVTSGTSTFVPVGQPPKKKDGIPAPIPAALPEAESKINENLKNLSPKQLQSLLRIRRLFRKPPEDNNHIDEAMAVDMLKQSLGIDDATAKMYLGIQEEESDIVNIYLKGVK